MGHVPTGEIPAASAGIDVPGREYRRAGARRPPLTKRQVGHLGEWIAAQFLARNGFRIIERNVRIGRGEIDILAEHRGRRVAVEVKSAVLDHNGRADPIDAFDDAKRRQVWSLARRAGAWRVDVVAVGFRPDGIRVHWVPDV